MADLATISEAEWDLKVAQAAAPVLVDFSAPGCPPCRALHAVLHEIGPALQGKLSIYEMDVTQNFDLAGTYGIMANPTMILFKHGKPVWQYVGAMPKERLLKELARLI